MNSQHKAIRANITAMSPNRAIDYIKSFNLPLDQENYIIEMDVRDKSRTQVAMEYNVCPETVRNKRRLAYDKIADEINNVTAFVPSKTTTHV